MSDEQDNTKLFAQRDAWYAEAKQQTMATLPAFMEKLSKHQHDYSSICYALAAAATGAATALDRGPSGGITGFQAGAVMWEFMSSWNGIKGPAKLVKFENAIYPQYAEEFAGMTIEYETFEHIKKLAKERAVEIEKGDHAVGSVYYHMKSIAEGNAPFGMRVKDKR